MHPCSCSRRSGFVILSEVGDFIFTTKLHKCQFLYRRYVAYGAHEFVQMCAAVGGKCVAAPLHTCFYLCS